MKQQVGEVANEDKFSGNSAALSELIDVLRKGEMVAFAGAGVSVPLAPAWTPFLKDLIDAGQSEGFVPADEVDFLIKQVSDDPLELANTLEDLFTKARFRSKLSDRFHLNDRSTEAQDSIVALPFDSIFTLNFDDGLSTAFVKAKGRMPQIIRNDDTFELARWQQGSHRQNAQTPIIHWHGNVSAPDRMIFTADDYNRFYGSQKNQDFIAEIWRSRNLLAIGFGFKDPFLTRIAESTLWDQSAGNSHFALISHHEETPVSSLARKQYSRKYRLSPIFYSVKTKDDGSEDHSELSDILEFIAKCITIPEGDPIGGNLAAVNNSSDAEQNSPGAAAKADFEKSLLVGQNDRNLYVEPRLIRQSALDLGEAKDESNFSVEDIISSNSNFIITSPFEHGASTLGRRIVYECILAGKDAVMLDARELPDYKAKLSTLEAFKKYKTGAGRVLVLDNVNVENNERLLKEIVGIALFERYILLCRRNGHDANDLSDLGLEIEFEPLALMQLRREDIRTLANQLYDTFDSDMIAAAVEKTYTDLLDLCIPLTPSNVIMYISVIYKEGSFVALNRLQIMDRYIRDRLQRPSDAYKDSFNVDNKLEFLALFVYHLFNNRSSSFTRQEWDNFCEDEMARSLSYFDKTDLLGDLVSSRVIFYFAGAYIFKYKLFYSFLLGKYIGERPELIPAFVDDDRHLSVESLVETIAGTSRDNTYLVTSLVERLEGSINTFEETYKTGALDPYRRLEWALTDDEEEKVWRPVTERLANGPDSDAQVDKVKRSILSEQRTENQSVIVRDFKRIESSVSFNQTMLITALRESPTLDGELKIRSTKAILTAYQLVMQIGFLFSPIIATRRFFVWNNIAFFNEMISNEQYQADPSRKAGWIAGAIPIAVADRAVLEMGSKKLGHVYKHMLQKQGSKGFQQFLLFSLLIRAKPEGWEAEARLLINSLERRELYLKYMFDETMKQFRQDVNSNADRSALKRIVATIQAKRQLNKQTPSAKAISGVLRKLEKDSYFEKILRKSKPSG